MKIVRSSPRILEWMGAISAITKPWGGLSCAAAALLRIKSKNDTVTACLNLMVFSNHDCLVAPLTVSANQYPSSYAAQEEHGQHEALGRVIEESGIDEFLDVGFDEWLVVFRHFLA